MLQPETTPLHVKFFRNEHGVCLFDPDTFKMYVYNNGRWVESDDLRLREEIRFRSVELSRREALQHVAAR